MKKLILLAIFCFNPLFIEQNISNVYLKSCKKATQKNVWQENGWQENGCKANVLYAAVKVAKHKLKGFVCSDLYLNTVAQARSSFVVKLQFRKNLRIPSKLNLLVKRRVSFTS